MHSMTMSPVSTVFCSLSLGPENGGVFYAGSKDGQVKPCCIKGEKIEVMGGLLAHMQAVNSICTLDDNPFALVTGSQDKTIKLWNPGKESYEKMVRGEGFE